MNQNGVLTQVVKAAVIRDIAEGIPPDRQSIQGRIPFNLMKSEKLVWGMTGVDHLEVVTRRNLGILPRPQHPGGEGRLRPARRIVEQSRATTYGVIASPKPFLPPISRLSHQHSGDGGNDRTSQFQIR